MNNFDFNWDDPIKPNRPKKTYTDRRGAALDNMFYFIEPGDNEWGIPDTKPFTEDLSGIEWISFWDKSKISNNFKDPYVWENIGIHFYVEDFQFQIIWNDPDKWLPFLKMCRAVVAPDFSVYTDMLKAHQLWNAFRRQWCAKYWQDNGVNIVSCVTWSIGKTDDWYIYGIPQNTSIATSFVGKTIDKPQAIKDFKVLVDKLNPHKIFIKCSDTDERELRKHFEFDKIRVASWYI